MGRVMKRKRRENKDGVYGKVGERKRRRRR